MRKKIQQIGLVRLFLSCSLCPHKSIELIDVNMMGFPKSVLLLLLILTFLSHTHTKIILSDFGYCGFYRLSI